jgi:two-component system phosphate regulon sensor histidine kinase PhoR
VVAHRDPRRRRICIDRDLDRLRRAAVLGGVGEQVEQRADAQAVVFCVDIGPGADVVDADLDAVRQVLTNLMDNSLRYTPPGGRITCVTRRTGSAIAVSIRDNGSGITSDHLPRIFERFYRADQSRSREEGGTGLGLAIVKHLVEAHGGRVFAESQRGRGTTVTCLFPDAPA